MVETTRIRRLLLICGILASLLWIGTDIVAGMLWEGYSFVDQAISELSAIGAPTRPLVVPLLFAYAVLMTAFGLGVVGFCRKRVLRIIGGLMVSVGVLGFVGMPFPLQLGVAEAVFTNTMHSIIAGVVGFLFLLAMGFGAFACGKRFRLFSLGAFLSLIVVGAVSAYLAGTDITQHGFTSPPQWFGAIERIDIYGSMLWVVVLAIILLRAKPGLIGGNDARRGAGFVCMRINVRSHVKNRDFCSQLKIPIFLDFQSVICMSKVVRSVLKERGFFGKKEELVKCEKCRKKPAGQDGLCDSCRFGALLTQMIESREH